RTVTGVQTCALPILGVFDLGNGDGHENGGPDGGGGAVEAKDGVIQKSDGGKRAENGEKTGGEIAFANDGAPEAEEEEIERGMGEIGRASCREGGERA